MRANLLLATALSFALWAAGASGAETEKECGVSTYEMVDCLKERTAPWDQRLNAAYQTALKNAEPKQREQLRHAERLWVQYRDANCLYYDLGEGTIARIEAAECLYRMTKDRAQELEGRN